MHLPSGRFRALIVWRGREVIPNIGIDEGVGEGIQGIADVRDLLVGELWKVQDAAAFLDAQHDDRVGGMKTLFSGPIAVAGRAVSCSSRASRCSRRRSAVRVPE